MYTYLTGVQLRTSIVQYERCGLILVNQLDLVVEKHRYKCVENRLTVYAKSLLPITSERLLFHCDISDIEVLYYDFEKKPALIFATPNMANNFSCYTNKDDERHIEQLYNYIMTHGAKERLVNRVIASFGKHSSVVEVEKQKKAEKALAHAKELERRKKRIGCKERTEDKFTCAKCGKTWYVNLSEQLLNLGNLLYGSVYTLNQVKQLDKCPNCGSKAVNRKSVKFWVDKRGNVVDFEE